MTWIFRVSHKGISRWEKQLWHHLLGSLPKDKNWWVYAPTNPSSSSRFQNSKVNPVGTITLPVWTAERVVRVTFMVINPSSLMNVIMERQWIHVVNVVVSIFHQVIHYQSPNRLYTIVIKGYQCQSKKCYNISLRKEVQRMTEEHHSDVR